MTRAPSAISGIYAIRNVQTRRMYIGSSVDVYRRIGEHERALTEGRHKSPALQRDWNRWKRAGFEFLLLEQAPEADLNDREQAHLDRMPRAQRYNALAVAARAGSGPVYVIPKVTGVPKTLLLGCGSILAVLVIAGGLLGLVL